MHLDRARADAELTAGFSLEAAQRDLSQHLAFPWCQQRLAGNSCLRAVVAVRHRITFLKVAMAPATRMTIERASNGLTR